MRKVRFQLEGEEGAATYKVFPVQRVPFVLTPLSRTHQEVGVSSHDGCPAGQAEVHFQRVSTHRKPIGVQRDMVDTAILEVVGIGGIIPVQRLALDEANDHFLRFSALEQIVPVERGTARGHALRSTLYFRVRIQGVPLLQNCGVTVKNCRIDSDFPGQYVNVLDVDLEKDTGIFGEQGEACWASVVLRPLD